MIKGNPAKAFSVGLTKRVVDIITPWQVVVSLRHRVSMDVWWYLGFALSIPGHRLPFHTLLMKVHIGKAVVFPVVMYDVRVAPVAVLLLLRSLLCPHSRTCFQVVM